jgi:hypothetical protein
MKTDDLARITFDIAVQPRNVTDLTDARLMQKAIEQLGPLAQAYRNSLNRS